MNDYIAELQAVFLKLHGCEAEYVKTVPVVEEFQGETIFQGDVEVFDLTGHPKATRGYGWGYVANEESGRRYFTVLELPPVDSPQTAVKVAIMSEIKKCERTGKKQKSVDQRCRRARRRRLYYRVAYNPQKRPRIKERPSLRGLICQPGFARP